MMLFTTLVVSFFKNRGGSVNVQLWFLVVYAKERNDQCGNQHYSRELLMIGIVVPETY